MPKSPVKFVCKLVTFLLLLRNTIFNCCLALDTNWEAALCICGRKFSFSILINKLCLFLLSVWGSVWGCHVFPSSWRWAPCRLTSSSLLASRSVVALPADWLTTWSELTSGVTQDLELGLKSEHCGKQPRVSSPPPTPAATAFCPEWVLCLQLGREGCHGLHYGDGIKMEMQTL